MKKLNWNVGVDVSKATLDVCILPHKERLQVNNDEEGIRILVEKLKGCTELLVMEATGGLQMPLAVACQEAGIPFAVVNPRQIRDFAKAMGHLAKTDKLDAYVNAYFGERLAPNPQVLLSEEHREFEGLVRRRSQLVQMRSQEKNRLSALPPSQQRSVKRVLTLLTKEIGKLEASMDDQIRSSPLWKAQDERAQGAKGVGDVTSRTIIGRLPELGKLSHGKLAKLVGVAPLNNDSGKSAGKRTCWGGRSDVRAVLYMAAETARIWMEEMKVFYDRLIAKGKAHKVAITACSRKLLRGLNAAEKAGVPFDPKKLLQRHA